MFKSLAADVLGLSDIGKILDKKILIKPMWMTTCFPRTMSASTW